MQQSQKHAVWGFLFGTVGLFVLSALALMVQFVEVIAAPFVWPGRRMAEAFVGPNGSNADVLLLTLANGVLYAVVFVVVGRIIAYVRAR